MDHNNNNNDTTTQRLGKHDTSTTWRQYADTAVQGTIGQWEDGGGRLAGNGGGVGLGWWWNGGNPWRIGEVNGG